jgi:hypothetical protein
MMRASSCRAIYDTKIFESDPFAKLDQAGVGQLMEMAVKRGRSINVRSSSAVSAASTAAIPVP